MSFDARNILIVDDNPSDSTLLSFVVRRMGHNPIVTNNAYEAIDLLARHGVSLILLDWQMPQLSGIDFLKGVRRQPLYADIPVVIVSGRNEMASVTVAVKAGANDYLIKPVDPAILEAKIAGILSATTGWQVLPWPKSEASVVTNVTIVGANEVGVLLRAEHALSVGDRVRMHDSKLQLLGIEEVWITILRKKSADPAEHLYEACFVGLREGDLKRIRMYLMQLRAQQPEAEISKLG